MSTKKGLYQNIRCRRFWQRSDRYVRYSRAVNWNIGDARFLGPAGRADPALEALRDSQNIALFFWVDLHTHQSV